jgi:hypothetical protein
MQNDLVDMLDEIIQDLDEAGFPDDAEQLYDVTYEGELPSVSDFVREAGLAILRVQSHHEGELPQKVIDSMLRCLAVIRRTHPDLSLE